MIHRYSDLTAFVSPRGVTAGHVESAMGHAISLGGDPWRDMSEDLSALDRAASGRAVLRLYSWDNPVVVLGSNQPLSDVNHVYCSSLSIPVVRRPSGGTGVIHRGDIGISLALPASHPWAGGIRVLYGSFTSAVAKALQTIGVVVTPVHLSHAGIESPVCFEHHGPDGLYLRGLRVFGSAQVRRKDAVLIHGTLLLSLDPSLYAAVFRVSPDRIVRTMAALNASYPRLEIAEALYETLHELLRDHDVGPPDRARAHRPDVVSMK